MTTLFEAPVAPETSGKLAGYGLNKNPFVVDESRATISGDDAATRFRRMVCAHEIQRVADLLAVEVGQATQQPVWIKEDPLVPRKFNNVVSTGIFRALMASESPRILPVYVALPKVAIDLTGNIFKLIIDRMLPGYFKNVVYAYIYQELKQAAAAGVSGPDFDPDSLVAAMDATGGVVLDEILFGGEYKLTDAETYGVIIEPEPEPEPIVVEEPLEVDHDAEEEAAEVTETEVVEVEVVEEEPIDPRRDAVIAFVRERVEDETNGFGLATRRAIASSLTDGFVKSRLLLEEAPDPKNELLGLIRLAGRYYNGIVVLVDQLEGWVHLDEQQRITLLSAIYEFELLSGGKAVFTVVSSPAVYDDFDPRFTGRCTTIPLKLTWVTQDPAAIFGDQEKLNTLVEEFLSPVRTGDQTGVEPFTEAGLKHVFDKVDGSPAAFIELCGQLLDKGAGDGFVPIDEVYADKGV